MQRTFSSFPSGWAGAALLVLRIVVGAAASLEASLSIVRGQVAGRLPIIAIGLLVIAGLSLIFGFLTPIVSVIVCLTGTWIMVLRVPPSAFLLFDSKMASFEFIVMSAVLVILGPGAISVDARLYGRRQVAIRDAPRMNDS